MNPIVRLMELGEDWLFLLRRDGVKRALPDIGLAIARLPFRHLHFLIFARSLVEPLPGWKPKLALEIRPFETADLASVRNINKPSEARLCARRLALGHVGLIAYYQGQPAGYAWGFSDEKQELERFHLRFQPGDVFCTDAFTAPPFRGMGVHTALTLERFRVFREMGFRRVISYIGFNNAPSLATWQRKLGCSIVGQVDFIRIGSWYRVRITECT